MTEEAEHFQQQFLHGVELFNTKEFFDCHDAFEELWMEERGEMKLFLQGLIQAAVACHHLSNGNTTGAISQYNKSLDKLRRYDDSYGGIDVKSLRTGLERCLGGAEAMLAGGANYEVDPKYFPAMNLISQE
jgi:predicted metal-dependent hydrolase